MGGLGVEDAGPVRLGQDLGAPGVDQQVGVPGGQEAGRGRRARVGQGRPGQVEQLPAPVAKYLRLVLRDGQNVVQVVRLRGTKNGD